MNKTYQTHEFLPVYDQESRVLILGSFPSVKSRETGFYYGHPKNRFWKLLAFLYDTKEPVSIEGKKEFLKERKIALWDVIESCEIAGSSDSSIQNARVNDMNIIFNAAVRPYTLPILKRCMPTVKRRNSCIGSIWNL